METPKNICFLVLIGIPGAGKTYLSERYVQSLSKIKDPKIKSLVVSYDKIIKLNNALLADIAEFDPKSWSHSRNKVANAVYDLINFVKYNVSLPDKFWQEDITTLELTKNIEIWKTTKDYSLVFIIDDNMYYRSMRYVYYKMARELEIGYCQVLVTSNLSVCRRRNNSRINVIPDGILTNMSAKLEKPNTKNNWEKLTLVYDNSQEQSEAILKHLEQVFSMVLDALENPISDDQKAIEKKREESKVTCLSNMAHQLDVYLRSLVKSKLQSAIAQGLNVEKLAQHYQARKREIISMVKAGELLGISNVDDIELNKEIIENLLE